MPSGLIALLDDVAGIAKMAATSLDVQREIEAADTMPFEIYRQEYTSPDRLGRPVAEPVVAAVHA